MTEQLQHSTTAPRPPGKASSNQPSEGAKLARVVAAKRRDRRVRPEVASTLKDCLRTLSPRSTAGAAPDRFAEAEAAEREAEARQLRDHANTLWRRSSVPARHSKRLSGPRDHPWWTAMEQIAALPAGSIALLIGPRGTGKTQMGVHAIGRACRAQRSALYTIAAEIFLELREAMNAERGGGSESRVMRDLEKPDVLVIDEVHERSGTDWESLVLTSLIDRRYRAMKTTIIISNEERAAALQALGPSVHSRMLECGAIVACNWPSFRGAAAQEHA